jgi:glycerophosphoryl diester phosphodiesterase
VFIRSLALRSLKQRGVHPRRNCLWIRALLGVWLFAAAGCGDDDDNGRPANVVVRERIEALAPAANIGHRGTGETRQGHPFPENSLASFHEAIRQGADGIELDVELTADGRLVVMHDDTLDRTTECAGCVSRLTFEEVRSCRLLDGSGEPTDEIPPTLEETFANLPPDALVNVELKAFGDDCRTATTGPDALAAAAIEEIERLGVTHRTFFSSFDEEAAGTIKEIRPDLYSALLVFASSDEDRQLTLALQLDALHPFFVIASDLVGQALGAGLQVNVWTVNAEGAMNESIDKGVSAIITNEPAILFDVLEQRRG